MNGKIYVGRNVGSFRKYNPESPVTGVRLLVDDENGFEAGDMSGNVWEMENPYATQEMADNILAGLKGKSYTGFEATAAPLGADAELGDGVTVNGLYSVLAYRKLTFGPGNMSAIAAPGDDEPEEEYKYITPKEREEARKLGQVRSLITKTAEQIRLEVSEAVSGLTTAFDVKLDGIRGEITDAVNGVSTTFDAKIGSITTQITGLEGRTSTLEQTAEGLSTSVSGLGGRLTTVEQTASGLTSTVQGLGGQFSTLEQTVNGFTFRDESGKVWINNGNINLTGAISWDDLDSGAKNNIYAQHTYLPSYIKSTYIDGTEVASPVLKGGIIAGAKFYELTDDGEPGTTWIEVGPPYKTSWGGLILKSTDGYPGPNNEVFAIYNGDFDTGGMKWKGEKILQFDEQVNTGYRMTLPQNVWDFSECTVTGLKFA